MVGRDGHAGAWAPGGWDEVEGGGEEGGEDSAWGQHGWGLARRLRGIRIGIAQRSGIVYTIGIQVASSGAVVREVLLEAVADNAREGVATVSCRRRWGGAKAARNPGDWAGRGLA